MFWPVKSVSIFVVFIGLVLGRGSPAELGHVDSMGVLGLPFSFGSLLGFLDPFCFLFRHNIEHSFFAIIRLGDPGKLLG